MATPIHYLHMYQLPMIGSSFIKRYPVYNYQHTISNQGWFDTASCDIAVRSQSEGFDLLANRLGCYVAIYVDNPTQPIWEGLINRITFNSGKVSYTIGLDDMANRVSVVYTGGANTGVQTPVVNDLSSQAIYGIKQGQIEFGTDASGGSTQRTNLRDTLLIQQALPQTSVSQAQGQTNLVHFELIGIFHTLEWEKFFVALSAATTAFNTSISSIIAGLANGATFFDNTNTTQISTNAATEPNQQRGVSAWERLQKMADAGDATNYWVCGIAPTDRNTGKRTFYYRQANYAINYTANQDDGLIIRNQFGKPVPVWLVVPDQVIRVNDILVGHDTTILSDPRATYIQSIQYDANSQQVTWLGADNTTARAAFALNKSYKSLGLNMPGRAPTRTITT